jgi:uncharacterized protein YdbL (DUF1318 family)
MITLSKGELLHTTVCGLPRAQSVTKTTLQYAEGQMSVGEYAQFYLSWTPQEQNKANNLISGIKTSLLLAKAGA